MYRLHFDNSDNTYCVTKGWKELGDFIWGGYKVSASSALSHYTAGNIRLDVKNNSLLLSNSTHSVLHESETIEEMKMFILMES